MIRQFYEENKQGHVFSFFNKLEFGDQQTLTRDAYLVDLPLINSLYDEFVVGKGQTVTLKYDKKSIMPVNDTAIQSKEMITEEERENSIEMGYELIRDGQVAVIVLAGGTGARLGFDRSKGEYSLNLPSMKSIFQILLEKFLKAQMLAHNSKNLTDECQNCKFMVMTNPLNHIEIQKFFEFNNYFGASKESIVFFEQQVLPIVNFDGKIIMEEPNKIVLAPNGSGAIFDAINNNIRVKEIIDSISYVQIIHVDNPISKVLDPLMIGFSQLRGNYVTVKACTQRKGYFPQGGLFVIKDQRFAIMDNQDLLDLNTIRQEALENMNIFMLKADKLSELCSNAENLSYLYYQDFHRHNYWDFKTMKLVKPLQNNAYKFELRLTDMLPFVEPDKFGILLVNREDEYAPVIYADNLRTKTYQTSNTSFNNSTVSEMDSNKLTIGMNSYNYSETPQGAKDLIFQQSVRWLKNAGAQITSDYAHVEVDTLLSYDGEGLIEMAEGKKMPPPNFIKKPYFRF
ncbi:udp-n-acetylglucosamine pyrophosphorylase [Stylonychia lemnae]|uniref:UDP-N-acetylglucosamine diphosphorylase n=1 Tax=Stylonychia lemnae TaxID=5949 RepID=A0A078A4N3_STYLE|nr:udp-n-acetylglucosamine pyrophosphorylase [Stylonychia lemnae]|eukprot:CDW76463.1 udp-n-acetylglucosamine pyrophosphorylase [Stylonychia lemnae]